MQIMLVVRYKFEFSKRKIIFIVRETKIFRKSIGMDVAFQKVLLETKRSKLARAFALPG